MPQAPHLVLLQDILVAGKPHLGTDRLVRILRCFREHLLALGVQVHFGACATDFAVQNGRVTGVQLRGEVCRCTLRPAPQILLSRTVESQECT